MTRIPRHITLRASFGYALRGIWFVARSERNFQIHLVAVPLVVVAAYWVQCTPTEWAILCMAMGFVLVAEALNTAIERVVDLVSPEYNTLAGHAKDIAAGGVLLAAITAVVVAVWILGVPLYQRFVL